MESLFVLGTTAVALGTVHALEPGHGKTAMAGALLGSTNKWRDPLRLAFATAFGHAFGVLLIACISFAAVHHFAAEQVQEYIGLVVGTILFLVGARTLIPLFKLSHRKSPQEESSLEAPHADACACCNHALLGISNSKTKQKQLTMLGFLVGLVPCPSAIALALSAISVGSLTQASLLAICFGAGVAVTLGLVGVFLTHSSAKLSQFAFFNWISRKNKIITPVIFVVLGASLIWHSAEHEHATDSQHTPWLATQTEKSL